MINKYILLLFLALSSIQLSAHGMWSNFERIDMQDGLVDNSVYSILKDKEGFLWFGTGNGLSRYDGKVIRNFIPDIHNNITRIYDTAEGMLLFITNNGLNCFDRYGENFIGVYDWENKTSYHTEGICMLNDSMFWSVSRNELHLLEKTIFRDKDNKPLFISLKLKGKYILTQKKEYLNNICLSSDKNSLYITTNQSRLLIIDCLTGKVQKNRIFPYKAKHPIKPTSLVCDKGYLWISFIGEGVVRYDIQRDSYEHYSNPLHKKTMLSHNDVYDFVPIGQQEYLAATWDGYTIFSPGKSKECEYLTEINDRIAYQPYNLSTRMISVYYDPQGVVYIGTHGGGVIISNLKEQFYNTFYQEQTNEICGITADKQKYIWLATFSGEILRSKLPFDPSNKMDFESVRKPVIRGENAVLCVTKDKQGNLWFGNSNSSISYYNIGTKEFTDYLIPPDFKDAGSSGKSVYVWTLFIDRQDRLWLGTSRGLMLFNRKTATFAYPELVNEQERNFSVRAIAQGKDDEIWLGTPDGLYKLQYTDKNRFQIQKGFEIRAGVEARFILSLLSVDNGKLYIAYTMGLGILSNDTISEFYSTKDGLCSNFVSCITEDAKGNIWLGTNSGISRYSKHQGLFYNYYISGNNKSAAMTDNTLFWGNNNTLTYFDTSNIITFPKIQKPLLLDIEIRNKRVEAGEIISGQIILEKGLPYTKAITLKYENRDFSLRFNNLEYPQGLQKYSYRLLPYQKEWLSCDENGKVSYTNLPAGQYKFEVKSIYPEGTESAESIMNVTIRPHWTQTWWLRLSLVILTVVVSFLFVQRYRRKQKRMQHELKLEHELEISNIERNNEKRLREERENFFMNAAHELRTPLTLVLSPLKGLLSQKGTSDKDYQTLNMMLESGHSLQRLVDDLLCVQKIDAGMMKLKISKIDIVSVVKEVVESFKQLAGSRNLDFGMESTQESIILWIDVEKIVSAIRNLISNAFKYTLAKGKICLLISEIEIDNIKFCRIDVVDNGIGISEEFQNKIFDSFVTGEADPAFSTKIGIGLYIVKNTMDMHHGTVCLHSKPGTGSIFTLYIPEGHEHFANDCHEVYLNVRDQQNTESIPEMTKEEEKLLYSYKRYTILVIEDNPDIRKYIAGIFSPKYYTILEAENGQEGVELAKKKNPDLIISDIMMPVKDGFECSSEIRQEQETAHIPIIMLTAKAEDADVIRSTKIGVDDYMMKPFNPELLKAKAENLLMNREQLKRLYTKALLLKDTPGKEPKEQEDSFMQQVINIIESNLTNESFGVKMLAEALNISQPTLYRKIKQRSDLSIIEVIRSVRMSRAASLLIEHKYSIQDISSMVGFTDPNTFRKHFTEQFGVPPSKYV